MSNLAPASSAPTADVLLDDLRAQRRGQPPLPGLEPGAYARDHAAFELLSDQRAMITEHLAERLVRLGPGPVSVLSVGCGDGSLDARLAARLLQAAPGRAVRYVGVDPFAGSAERFAAAMAALGSAELHRGLDTDVQVAPFAGATFTETFDVVTFVHSMYYVDDVAETLRAALALLRPGGQLWVLDAPRAELNALVDVLAPRLAGHRQWFSADVAEAFEEAGIGVEELLTLQARVALAEAPDDVLDFAVQARLTPALRTGVRAYLDAVSAPGADGVRRVPHPVDLFRATRPA